MRFLLEINLPNELFNSFVKDGSAGSRVQAILADTKPEAAYFCENDGKRTAYLVVNLHEVSQIPSVAEPWFLQFKADVKFHPVMLGEDLEKANLPELGKKWG